MKIIYKSQEDFDKIKNNQSINKIIHFSDYISEIINDNFNELYDHTWTDFIYVHQSCELEYKHIFFKNILICKIEIKKLNDQVFLKDLIFDIINKIKNESIILSIYYLPDIINIDYEVDKLFAIQGSNKELNTLFIKKEIRYRKYCIDNMYDIEFSIENDKISFYVKRYKFFECLLKDIKTNLINNKIFDLYNEIKKTKKKILLNVTSIKYYDNDFILDLFKLGYWVNLKISSLTDNQEKVETLKKTY